MGFYSGVAGARGYAPRAIVYHNDAGSQGANAAFYRAWLPSHNPELGFAHAYVASDGTFIAENYMNKAWHCGNSVGNRDYIGIEICQSMGDLKTFQQNEQKAFKLGAQICKQFGLTPTPALFPLHKELSSTSCPHRTWDIHGRSIQAIRQYYADQTMKYFKDPNLAPTTNGGSTSTGGNTGNTSAGGYKAEVYNVRQVVDVNGLQVRPRQDTTLGAIRTLNKGFTFNATRICKNGQAVKGNDGNTYSTWLNF